MQFDHHNMTGAHLAVALVNQPEPWDPAEVEQLLREHWIRTGPVSGADCGRLQDLAGRLRPVFEAGSVEDRSAAVNALLEGRGSAFLALHDDLPLHLHFAPSEDDLLARVQAYTAGSLAVFLVETAGQRLGVCARTGCGTVFVDTSRGGRRGYCSARCANDDAVGRHRRRTAQARR